MQTKPGVSKKVFSLYFIVLFVLIVTLFQVVKTNAQDTSNPSANTNTPKNNNGSANTNTPRNTNTGANTNAAGNPTALPVPTAVKVACPTAEEFNKVKVTKANKTGGSDPGAQVQIGDEISVEVENLSTLLHKAECTNPKKKILLFLDGRPINDVTPFPPTDPGKTTLIFPLKRTENSREVWTYILGKPGWGARVTKVSVGLEDEYPVESTASVKLEVIPPGWFTIWFILFILLVIGFWALAVKSDVLRDTGPNPTAGRKPYSLAKTQAAWWFFIILASYLFIGTITGDFSTSITGTVITLLGISAGTVVSSAFIDEGKTNPPAAGAVAAAPPKVAATNDYWWIDILSDANGVSFHRFQMAAWTLVLGIIFIIQVYKVLAMPTFDGTLLGLMGISAGTYLGLKIPEPKPKPE